MPFFDSHDTRKISTPLAISKRNISQIEVAHIATIRKSTCWNVIKYFQKYMPAHFEANQEAVFKLAFDININQKKMKKLEKEYTTMKTREKEDEIEIRVSFLLG